MNITSLSRAVLLICCGLSGILAAPLQANDLVSIYQQALGADPVYQAAVATRRAAIEIRPQSRAVLLPDISLRGTASRERFDPRSSGETSYATNQTYSLNLRQALYQRDRFVALEQADSRIAEADAVFAAAQQDLLLRVATQYFDLLGAQDNLEFVRADKEAIARTLEQAEQRFEVGLAAITDSLEAQARFDTAVSEEIAAEQLLADTREALRELTGAAPGNPGILQAEIPLIAPEPADREEWVLAAIAGNPQLLAARQATETAKREIERQRSGHYPSLDMTADFSYLDNRFGGFADLERNDSSVGLEFNIPLYQGGLVNSRTRQSLSEYEIALKNQVRQYRATERQTRDDYRAVISGISRVRALARAVESNEKATEAAATGFEVGTRTIVDVLDAQRELLRARRDHARSRYDYLLNTLRLKQAAGILDSEDLGQINKWLVAR